MVHGDGMALDIRGVVGEGAEREGVLVEVFLFAEEIHDEIAAADVVDQVAEEMAAEWVVAHVLEYAAGIGIAMRFLQLFRFGLGIPGQQQRLDVGIPSRVDDGFVSEDGIAVEGGCQKQERSESESGTRHSRLGCNSDAEESESRIPDHDSFRDEGYGRFASLICSES